MEKFMERIFHFRGKTSGFERLDIPLKNPVDSDVPDAVKLIIFDLYYWAPKVISETIGPPPKGSGFKSTISQKNIKKILDDEYYSLTYIYDASNGQHSEYTYKLQNLILNLIRWEKKRYYKLEDEFEKYNKE